MGQRIRIYVFYVGDNVVDNLCSSTGYAVVGTAMIGTHGFLVGAVPSRLLTSSNPVCDDDTDGFEVSIEEPPPMAIR